jgi:hypothetical protein
MQEKNSQLESFAKEKFGLKINLISLSNLIGTRNTKNNFINDNVFHAIIYLMKK